MKKIIAVVGATGTQGGGLARAILHDPDSPFRLRTLVRNPQSEKALELGRQGAEIVQANLSDPASIKAAFEGAYGAFCVTNFGELGTPEKELEQIANMAEAAKEAELQHVIWSTLDDPLQLVSLDDERIPTVMGKHKLPQAEGKAAGNHEFIRRNIPTTFLLTSFYWENFLYPGMGPTLNTDGVLSLTLPMGQRKLPGIGAEDIGRCAYGIFKSGDEYIGQTVGIAGGHLTGQEMAAAFSQVLNQKVHYHAVEDRVFRHSEALELSILANTYQFYHDFEEEYCGARNLEQSKQLNPAMQTLEDWITRHKDSFPF
ncbi:NmrA/HSCARG family protein [Paenibacillus shenyangensis]|uniref:NmrA/HSCARG family protein n=1 Tax=Paenibacillus sp. A9 TaxID=1284352 RepID=UPI000371A0B5|nr:NmrA/HSCARG family protein [Paenibacillus sp. A9]